MRFVLMLAFAGLTTTAFAQATVQQDYEAATALDEKGDHAAALEAWRRFEQRPGITARTRAIAKVRQGAALFQLSRPDEAAAVTRAGLAELPPEDPTLAMDRWRANFNLGQLAETALDYGSAASSYAAAEGAAPEPFAKVVALLGLVRVETFVDSAAAVAALARLDEVASRADLKRADLAQVARAHTLVFLNTGDLRAAKASAIQAVGKLGGVTDTTTIEDARARSDAAIVYLLSNSPDDARYYMAMSGAGRLKTGSFDPAAEMRAPDCGGEDGLKPADVAVVEFSIDKNGRTVGVRPIYAAGGPAAGLAFARAVRDWSWEPEKVAEIPPFFRVAARIEMRCSTAFERPSVGDSLSAVLKDWLMAKGVPVPPAPEGSKSAAIPAQRAALAAAIARSPTSLSALAALVRLGSNPVISREEQIDLFARALAIARANDAPPLAQLALDLSIRQTSSLEAWEPAVFDRLISPMLGEPVYARDAQARAAIRLILADRLDAGARGRPDGRPTKEEPRDRAYEGRVLTLLQQITEDKGLDDGSPYRIGALIRIASIRQRNGDVAAARAAFERSGLGADQCALMDAPPKITALPGSDAFPREAAFWGFEGWTQVQYDVSADGHAMNPRALLSYPPFIFTKAGTEVFREATFAKTYRPDGGLGCGSIAQRVRFHLPSR